MNQVDFNFPLTEFELETAKAHVLFGVSKGTKESQGDFDKRVVKKLNSEKFEKEVRALVLKWGLNRIKLGLKPFR